MSAQKKLRNILIVEAYQEICKKQKKSAKKILGAPFASKKSER